LEDQGKSKEQLISELASLRGKITELNKSEHRLKRRLKYLSESEERFRLMTENIHEVFWIAEPGKHILYISPAYEKIWGHSCESLYARPKSFLKAIHPEDRGRVLAALRKQIKGEQTSEEYRIVRPDGSTRWIWDRGFPIRDNTGKFSYVTGIAEDITERKQAAQNITARKGAEEKLQQSEEQFRTICENAPVMIDSFDQEGKCLLWNKECKKTLGWTKEEINACDDRLALFYPDPNVRNQAAKTIKITDGTFREYCVSTKDGSTRIQLWANFLLPNGTVISVGHDITERKRLENDLSRAQRLETAGRVAGQIAHDFNNLLSPLAAYPILLRDYFSEDHSALKILAEMEYAANKVAEINQQLLALGRRGYYEMELINLNELIQETVVSQKIVHDCTLRETFAKDLFLIKGGGAQLSRILNNLIANAGEALQGSGTISVVTENIYLDKPLKGYKTVKVGEYVMLKVSDTGTGIKPEILDKIFDPFFTTKKMDKNRGSGLGLSVVHGIVEDHKGYIAVKSTLGEGTIFSLYFPVARDEEIVKTVEKAKGGNEKILVVDDDPMQRKVATKLLKRLGYRVHSAPNGEQAVTYLKKHRQELLLLDMVMDGIDGTETYRQILEIQPKQKAIILSGYAKSHRVEEALRLGAGALVMKPITLKALASAVRRELDKTQKS